MVSSPIWSQPSPSNWRLMICGVSRRAWGMSAMACLKCALLTWSPAASSLKASTRTNSLGSSTLRDQSNHRLPGSWRVAWVKSCTRPSQRSDHSGLTLNLTTMKITGTAFRCGDGVPFLQSEGRVSAGFDRVAGQFLLPRGADAVRPLRGELELHHRLGAAPGVVQRPAEVVVQGHEPLPGPLVVHGGRVFDGAAGPGLGVGGIGDGEHVQRVHGQEFLAQVVREFGGL